MFKEKPVMTDFRLRAIGLVLFLLPTVSACGGGGGGGNGGGGGGSGPGPGPAVTTANAGEFITQFDTNADAALGALTSQIPALLSKARSKSSGSKNGVAASATTGLLQALTPIDVAGQKGSARIQGAVYPYPWPPRFEVSTEFTGYSTDGVLYLNGFLNYNFIVDDRVSPPVIHGLSRGTLTPEGSFGGTVEVRTAIEEGARTDTLLTADGADILLSAAEPPSFLTYTSTLAGDGTAGNQNGTGSAARFDEPQSVTVDEEGTVYVTDTGNGAIREISPEGVVTTLASGFYEPYDLEINPEGDLVVSDQLFSSSGGFDPIRRIIRKGPSKGSVTPIVKSDGLLCTAENFYIFSNCDGRSPIGWIPYARGIDIEGGITLVAQWALPPTIRAILPDGYVMTLQQTGSDCGFQGINDLALGTRGEIYYVGYQPGCYGILVLETDGTIRTLAGKLDEFGSDDGIGEEARFFGTEGITFDGVRYLYVVDTFFSLVRRVDTETGEVIRMAGCLSHEPGFDCTNPFGFRDGWRDDAQFDSPGNVALDEWGDMYVADTGNHSIRFIRIIADPDRTPTIDRFDPWTMQKGESGEVTIFGTNLALAEAVDLGSGVTAEIQRAGYGRLVLDVTVSDGAQAGPRSISVTTAFGSVTTPESLSLEILETSKKGPTVETISGTGEDALDVSVVPAELAAFSFPTGLFAEDPERLLVADPLTQTVRLVSTKVGAIEELVQLLTYEIAGQDVNILGGILGALGSIGNTLDSLGISSSWTDQAEDEIRDKAEQAVDEVCQEAGSDCEWMSLPWAGAPFSPGTADGFRLDARFSLPTDIWYAGSGKYVIADTFNSRIRPVGYDFENDEAAPMKVFSTGFIEDHPFSAVLSDDLLYATLPAQGTVAQVRYTDGDEEILSSWGGLRDRHECELGNGGEHPLGVPMGMAATSEGELIVADPYCKTVFRITQNLNVPQIEDFRGEEPAGLDKCADGPVVFATFGAPMDVAIDGDGNIYVADAGCHSIRMIKDMGFDAGKTASSVGEFLEKHKDRVSEANYDRIQGLLGAASSDFLDLNRYWVITIAGGADGQPGFADGPAESARFNAPTSIAYVKNNEGKEFLFVADTGNQRIRRIVIP